MDFLKRHYEKLILLVLLLAFIVSMSYILNIINETKEITKEKLAIPETGPDYVSVNEKEDRFDIAKLWSSTKMDWRPAVSRSREKAVLFSDLTEVFPMAKCPHCSKAIPLFYFNGLQCPECKNEAKLPKPPEKKEEVFRGEEGDRDGDGLPDVVENRYGLNPADPYDGREDMDGDGFSNVYEHEMKTDINNAKSHPPYWHRFKVVALKRVKLPLIFKALNTNKSKDPARWDIQINNTSNNRTNIVSLNDYLELDRKTYKIVRIEAKQTEIPSAAKNGSPTIKDESILYLEQEGGNAKMTMQVGQEIFSANPKAIMIDMSQPKKELILDVGEMLSVGTRRSGIEKFRIYAIDQDNTTVTWAANRPANKQDPTLDAKGEKMIIKSVCKIPEERLIRLEEEDSSALPETPQTAPESSGRRNKKR